MIGQDDELVRTGRILGGLCQRADRGVDPVERLERLDPLRAAVMGELVVVGEVAVDDVRAAIHLLDDQRRVHVAQQDVAGGPHPGVLHAAVHLGGDAGAPRPSRLQALLGELGEEHRERAEVAARAEEEAEERVAVAEALGRSLIAPVVTYARVASPVIRLQMLAPSFDSRPSPFDRRRTISAASSGLLETISFWRSRSYQRKAGIPSLVPWRMPAWLAEVIDGRIASQRESLWVPSRIQLPIVLTDPARTRLARIGCARPSIWMMTRPGLSEVAPRHVWP